MRAHKTYGERASGIAVVPMTPTTLFMVLAFTALGLVSNRKANAPLRFCDSTRTSKSNVDDEPPACIPCPGKCRDGHLVGCHVGYVLKGNSNCVLDILFQNKVDVLKQDLETDVLAKRQTVSELRQKWEGNEPKVFDLAFEQILRSHSLHVENNGVIFSVDPDTGTSEMAEGSPLNTAMFFLVFVVIALFLRYRERREVGRRQQRPNYVDPQHFLGASANGERDSQNSPEQSTLDSPVTTSETSAATSPSTSPLPLTTPPESTMSSNTNGGSSTKQDAVPRCTICASDLATEALIPCGHLICCQNCVGNYMNHMQQSANYRCPQCRQESYGQWIHIHGLGS